MGYSSNERKGLLPLKFTIAFLLAPLASLSLIVDKASAGNFIASCEREGMVIDRTFGALSARCRKIDGILVLSTIRLNTYITNNNGRLEWFTPSGGQEGNFWRTCSFSAFNPSTGLLSTSCRKIDQTFRNTSINLNSRISNIDGTLTYDR